MAYDFDKDLKPQKVLAVLKRKIRPGAIIVFHDKADSSVHVILEEFIRHCHSEGYRFVVPF
jgi:hypothetical protein